MADMVAPQVTSVLNAPVIPQGMGITFFDTQVILGIPIWIFVDAFFVFLLAAVIVWWWAKIRKLDGVKGWSESLRKMLKDGVQVWVLTRTQRLIIDCMKIEDNVLSYYDLTKVGMWHHNSKESVIRVGGVPAVVVSEDYDQTRDFIVEIALTDNCDEFNVNQDSLKKWKKENEGIDGFKNAIVSPIESYADYESHGREILQLMHPEGLPRRSYSTFNSSRFLKYFPLGCSHMFFGAEVEEEAKGMHDDSVTPQGFLSKYGLLMIAALVVMVMIGAAWFVPL